MPQRYTAQRVYAFIAALGLYALFACFVLFDWNSQSPQTRTSPEIGSSRQSTPAPVRFMQPPDLTQPTTLDPGSSGSGQAGTGKPGPKMGTPKKSIKRTSEPAQKKPLPEPLKPKKRLEAPARAPEAIPLPQAPAPAPAPVAPSKPVSAPAQEKIPIPVPAQPHTQQEPLPNIPERAISQAPPEPELAEDPVAEPEDQETYVEETETTEYRYSERTRTQARANAASLFGGSAFSQHARAYARAQRESASEGPEGYGDGSGDGSGTGSGGSGPGNSSQKARAIGWEFFMSKFVRAVCATSDQNPLPIPNDTVSTHTMVVNVTINRARKVTAISITVPSPKYYLNTYLERILSLTTIPQLPEEYPHDELTMPLRVHIKTCENLREIRLVPAYD